MIHPSDPTNTYAYAARRYRGQWQGYVIRTSDGRQVAQSNVRHATPAAAVTEVRDQHQTTLNNWRGPQTSKRAA